MKRMMLPGLAALALAAMLVSTPCAARIKLTTLPPRDSTVIRLDNENFTLVEEERTVNLLKGTNQVDFSWANTSIDAGSIQFRCVAPPVTVKPGGVKLLSVSYPPGENSLVWAVYSPASGPAQFRISYVIHGLARTVSYRAVVENNEKSLVLREYLKLENRSGEDFEEARVGVGYGSDFTKTIENGESKQMLSDRFDNVPVKKTYTFDPARFGKEVPMHYCIRNDYGGRGKLGGYPLPAGKARIFQKDSRGTTAFLGEDWGKYTPVDDELELYLGVARDVKVKRKKMREDRTFDRGNMYHTDEIVHFEVENFKDTPVILDIYEHIPGEWKLDETSHPYEREDAETIIFHVKLPARPKGKKAEKQIVSVAFQRLHQW